MSLPIAGLRRLRFDHCNVTVMSINLNWSCLLAIRSGYTCSPMQYVGQSAPPKRRREKHWVEGRNVFLSNDTVRHDSLHGQTNDTKKDRHTPKPTSEVAMHSHGCQPTPPDDKKKRKSSE